MCPPPPDAASSPAAAAALQARSCNSSSQASSQPWSCRSAYFNVPRWYSNMDDWEKNSPFVWETYQDLDQKQKKHVFLVINKKNSCTDFLQKNIYNDF